MWFIRRNRTLNCLLACQFDDSENKWKWALNLGLLVDLLVDFPIRKLCCVLITGHEGPSICRFLCLNCPLNFRLFCRDISDESRVSGNLKPSRAIEFKPGGTCCHRARRGFTKCATDFRERPTPKPGGKGRKKQNERTTNVECKREKKEQNKWAEEWENETKHVQLEFEWPAQGVECVTSAHPFGPIALIDESLPFFHCDPFFTDIMIAELGTFRAVSSTLSSRTLYDSVISRWYQLMWNNGKT